MDIDGGFDLWFTGDHLAGALNIESNSPGGDLGYQCRACGGVGQGVDKRLALHGRHTAGDPGDDTLAQHPPQFVEELDDAVHLG